MRKAAPIRTAIPSLRSIFEHCESEGITTYDLATMIASSQSAISGYRTGRNAPSIAVIEEMCQALGLELVIRPATGSLDP